MFFCIRVQGQCVGGKSAHILINVVRHNIDEPGSVGLCVAFKRHPKLGLAHACIKIDDGFVERNLLQIVGEGPWFCSALRFDPITYVVAV